MYLLQEKQRHLSQKFTTWLLAPLILTIVISLVINLVCSIIFITNLPNDKSVNRIFTDRLDQISDAVIKQLKAYLYLQSTNPFSSLSSLENYISKFSNGGLNLDKTNTKMLDFIKKYSENVKDANENYTEIFSKGMWFADPDKTDPGGLSDKALSILYIFTNLNLVMQSYAQLENKKLSSQINLFTLMSKEQDLLYMYPYQNKPNFKNNFDKDKKHPLFDDNYYNYKSDGSFYIKADELGKNGISVSIHPPSKFINEENYFTYCLNTNEFILCAHSKSQTIIEQINNLNDALNGYFFITSPNNTYPIYFPVDSDEVFNKTILEYEFDASNDTNLTANATNQELLTTWTSYDDEEFNGSYYKNSDNMIYKLYRLKSDRNTTLLNIITIRKDKESQQTLVLLTQSIYLNILFQAVFTLVIALIMILIGRYSIVKISLMIVTPLKMVRQTLEGLTKNQVEKKSKDSKEENDEGSYINQLNDEESKKIIQYKKQPKEFNFLLKKLISLKKLIQLTVVNYDDKNPLQFIFAKEEFKSSENKTGSLFCDSNIGNIGILIKKYDKAIYHLKVSYDEQKKLEELNALVNNETVQTKNLRARHLKLLYAYKNYYDTLFYYEKYLTQERLSNMQNFENIFEKDHFVDNNFHPLCEYKSSLLEYIDDCQPLGSFDQRCEYINAKLEYLNFLIKYEAFVNKESKEIIIQIRTIINEMEDMIKSVLKEATNDYLYNLKMKIKSNKEEVLEEMDTPVYVLHQRLNYLKGKFCLMCNKYTKALKYYYMAKSNEPYKILDARISKRSIEMIQHIITKFSKNNTLLFFYKSIIDQTASKKDSDSKREVIVLVDCSNWYSLPALSHTGTLIADNLSNLNIENSSQGENLIDTSSQSDIRSTLKNRQAQFKETIHSLIINCKEISNYVFENVITEIDTFGLFINTSPIKIIIALSNKTLTTSEYILEQTETGLNGIKEYYNENKTENISETNYNETLEKGIDTCFEYLNKKESDCEERVKWVVVVGLDIKDQVAEKIINAKKARKNERVAFIEIGQGSDKKFVISKDELANLNSVMSNLGHLSSKTFKNERYENFNQFVKQ